MKGIHFSALGLGFIAVGLCGEGCLTGASNPVAATGGATAPGTGGALGAGGATGTGTGDATGAGGRIATSTGGTIVSGGGNGSGGASPTGGRAGTGGAAASGGTTSIGGAGAAGGTTGASIRVRPRIIITTDGEVDDRSSMIRFLVSSSDFDVAGIVQVNSRFQKNGHSVERWLDAEVNLYEQVLPNLLKHNPNYPTAAYLRSVMRVGNENIADLTIAPPDMATKNTAGEQLIINTLLDGDPRPVHVVSWGGANTTASALWTLKTTHPAAEFQRAVAKIRIYCIWYQDGGGQWIEDNIKEAYINEAFGWDNVWDYQSVGSGSVNPADVQLYMDSAWLNTNVKTGHGVLGAYTPQAFVSEGDTPSFLQLIHNGLDAQEDYALGGWGGRSIVDPSDPINKPKHLTDTTITDDGNRNKMYWRWVIDAQNDFAARMDWCVATTFAAANHQPIVQIVGGNVRAVSVGQVVTLDATGTADPDGNILNYLWWQYTDADSATTKISITGGTTKTAASFVVPNEPGKQIQIILEVKDSGTPPLKGYQRIIFNIQ